MSKAWKQMLRHISAHSPWYLQAFRPQQQTHTNNHHWEDSLLPAAQTLHAHADVALQRAPLAAAVHLPERADHAKLRSLQHNTITGGLQHN